MISVNEKRKYLYPSSVILLFPFLKRSSWTKRLSLVLKGGKQHMPLHGKESEKQLLVIF
jgi:hypothetical protein